MQHLECERHVAESGDWGSVSADVDEVHARANERGRLIVSALTDEPL